MLFPIWWAIRFIVWELLGVRAVWEKIRPPEPGANRRNPATIGLWLTGLYIVIFGLVSYRYENKINIINTRATALVSQIISVQNANIRRELAFVQIPTVQRMACPPEPDFWNPWTTLRSFIASPTFHRPTAEMLRIPLIEILESERDRLQGIVIPGGYVPNVVLFSADLSGADLSGTDLSRANLIEANLIESKLARTILQRASLIEADLSGADLREADLRAATLSGANLSGANLRRANLTGADLIEAILFGADLVAADLSETDLSGATLIAADLTAARFNGANLSNADLSGTNLSNVNLAGANLSGADLRWTIRLTADQLYQARTLYGAMLDDPIKARVEQDRPDLLKPPVGG